MALFSFSFSGSIHLQAWTRFMNRASGAVASSTPAKVVEDVRTSAMSASGVEKEGKRRADGESVQPQRNLRELDRHRILVDAVNASLEDHAAHKVAIVEMAFLDLPVVGARLSADALADRADPRDQRRLVGLSRI